MTRKLLAALALTLTAFGPAFAAPSASVPRSGKLAFDVIRNGRDIGDYVVTFHGAGNDLTVDIATDVSVKLPVIGVSAYRFRQSSKETWHGGQLAALTSQTDDNGSPHKISVRATSLIPASLWDADILGATQVLNTIDGSTDRISVRNLGTETVNTGAGPVRATHYALTGDLNRELWFAGSTLVHVRFLAEDGSQIDYVLR